MKNGISIASWSDSSYTISAIDNASDDLLITCLSYEPRSIGAFQKLDYSYKANMGLILVNEEFKKFNKVQENKQRLDGILSKSEFFTEYEYVKSSIDNPIKSIIEIDKILKKCCSGKKRVNITLDTTTFPRSELLTILYYIRHLPLLGALRILYVSPEGYGDWLSEGYSHSIIPPFFEGPKTFEKKIALLLLTGFEYDRSVSLIDDLGPAAILIGKPEPGTSPEFKDFSNRIVNRIKMTRNIHSEIFEMPANNPFECKRQLDNIMDKYSAQYDFFVAPMGPKLEAIGTYLSYEANEEKPKFRVIHSIPLVYNIGSYSHGCRDLYEIVLPPKS